MTDVGSVLLGLPVVGFWLGLGLVWVFWGVVNVSFRETVGKPEHRHFERNKNVDFQGSTQAEHWFGLENRFSGPNLAPAP